MDAQWVPWKYLSPNGQPTYYRDQNRPVACVLHIMQGYLTTARTWALEGHFGASWHISNGRDGTVLQHLRWTDGGYHAGIPSWKAIDYPPTWPGYRGPDQNVNHYTIGLENEGFVGEPWPEKQLASLKRTCQAVARECGFAYNRANFPAHADIDLRDRPNDFDYPGNREVIYRYLFDGEEEEMSSAEYQRLVKAIFGTEARIDELEDNLPVEGRLARLESNDGPIGKRLSALEDKTQAAGNILSEED